MNKITPKTVEEAYLYVMELFDENLDPEYTFHSKSHTQDVLTKSRLIGEKSGLFQDDMNIISMSAIFHDAGYIKGYMDHERLSSEIACEFLSVRGIEKEVIMQVEKAIASTEVPQNPGDIISGVLCDADLMHLSGEDYFEKMELLRKEWKLTGRMDMSELEFHLHSVEFFSMHAYHTEYGKTVLTSLKEENLIRIKEKISLLST